MLVSAAIEPYRKSCGNAARRAAIAGGRLASERSTASPRNMCVPGAHAYASDGNSAMARNATAHHTAIRRNRDAEGCAMAVPLDPHALSLAPDGLPKVRQFVSHRIVDGFARRSKIVSYLFRYLLARDAIPHLLAPIAEPAGATCGLTSCPTRSARAVPACNAGTPSGGTHNA